MRHAPWTPEAWMHPRPVGGMVVAVAPRAAAAPAAPAMPACLSGSRTRPGHKVGARRPWAHGRADTPFEVAAPPFR